MSNVVAIDHPLVQQHLTRLRNQSTSPEQFRLSIGRLAVLLARVMECTEI